MRNLRELADEWTNYDGPIESGIEIANRMAAALRAHADAVPEYPAVSDEPVATVKNKYGDPIAFAERELAIEDKVLQSLPIGARLYASPQSDADKRDAELIAAAQAVLDWWDVFYPLTNFDDHPQAEDAEFNQFYTLRSAISAFKGVGRD